MRTEYKSLFHIPPDTVFLNCAYMAPPLIKMEDIGIEGIRNRRKLHEITSRDFFDTVDQLKQEYALLIDASPASIALIPSVSYGMSTVAYNLPLEKGDNIIVAGEQFPSNYYPWQRIASDRDAILTTVAAPEVGNGRGTAWNERLLDAINDRTACVAISVTHWTDGTLFDLKALRKRTDEVGAWLVIDGTQSVGALPLSVKDLNPDALVCAGYKWLLGPYSLGLAYYGERMKTGRPIEENWINRAESEDFRGLVNYTNDYQPGNMRYSVGEHSNFILVPMALEAIRTVRRITPEYIQAHTHEITQEALLRLQAHGFSMEPEGSRANHLIGIRMPDDSRTHDYVEALSAAGLFVSWRGSALRISPHVYNTKEELTLLAEALLDVKKLSTV